MDAYGEPNSGERGLSLLEVLVAFLLLALVLGAALPLVGQGLAGTEASERRSVALIHAETRLAELIATGGARAAESSGEFADGFRWQASVQPLAAAGPTLTREVGLIAVEYAVGVAWLGARRGETVRLATVRLRPPEDRR